MGHRVKTKVTPFGKKVLKGIKELNGKRLKVGIIGEPDEDLLISAVANEFGTQDGRIPERSFIRSTFNENEGKYLKGSEGVTKLIVLKGASPSVALGVLGEQIVSDIQDKITTLADPPNAQSTIDQKGSDNPLVDSGHLRASISYEVDDKI